MATATPKRHHASARAERPVEERLRERLRRRPYTVEELAVAENLSAKVVRSKLENMSDLSKVEYYSLAPGAPLAPPQTARSPGRGA